MFMVTALYRRGRAAMSPLDTLAFSWADHIKGNQVLTGTSLPQEGTVVVTRGTLLRALQNQDVLQSMVNARFLAAGDEAVAGWIRRMGFMVTPVPVPDSEVRDNGNWFLWLLARPALNDCANRVNRVLAATAGPDSMWRN
jgi:hypothetical protein